MPPGGAFQDLLGAAVQLKTSLIKARPGRQEWEQAPPFMRCTAATVESVSHARQSAFSARLSTALQLKEQGNELISKDPETALALYTQAVSVFLWFDRGPDRSAEDVPLVCGADKLPASEREQAHHLLAVSFCNAAACLLQLGMPADAEYACSKALKYDPYNVKALYRRAMAHRAAESSAGLDAAVADLAAANQLEPANSQVRLALTAVQHELRELRRKERGMYGNLFLGGDLYDKETAAAGSGAGAPASFRPADLPALKRGGSDDDDDDGDEEDRGAQSSGQYAEDPIYGSTGERKVGSSGNAAAKEADVVMRRMQRSLVRARNRKMGERLEAERARNAGRFPWWAVPWWAYALIGLHLVYRVIKIWRVPLPVGRAGDPLHSPVQQENPVPAHGEL